MRCAKERAAFARILHQKVELAWVCQKSSCQSLAIDPAALGKLAYNTAALVAVFWKPDLGLLFERDNGFADLEFFQKARLYQES